MLSPPPIATAGLESDSSDQDPPDPPRSHSVLPLGHSSVKSLSTKFQQQNGQHHHQNGSNGEQQIIDEQKRVIENLKAQVTTKDRRIQQLEDQIKLLSKPLKPESYA